ncbi:hypothetical protein D3C72_1777170 [compost metagenome]
MGAVAAQQREAGTGHVALVVELLPVAALVEERTAGADDRQAQAAVRGLGIAVAVVGQRERQVLDGDLVFVVAEAGGLIELLVVQADGQRIAPVALRVHRVDGGQPEGIALAQHVGAADGGHVAVALVARELQAPAA